ncbi:SWI/SNF-related matrix-associated actin-dependent regulator of chromatin subfamily A member [Hibiscus syriacus]|uniref:SWI/SNF-related matrix-associated actin-dependent regulator of chromatin subfamily A member n=1 Tax=Hibiscus syriacus TaxID=106335 RepID=A0A6A3CVI4_HIBSY|nr:SWI/SNF-related matrix-associated actin-dependent regulator of chromatin subfamily A member [Hibiscus syriacus]
MEISRDKKLGRLCLSQKEYLRKVLKRFGMNEKSKPVSTPLASHFKLDASMSPKDDAEREYMSKVPYASVVGSLMYAMVYTRPDISQAVGVVSRYMHDPGKEHWEAMKWILRYILNTVDIGLVFQQDKQDGQCVVGYCDLDYAGDLDKRRSTTGYVFTFAKAPVSWKSTLQSTVALSTIEAEYMAVTEVVKEVIWLQGLFGELGMEQKHIKVHCDSQSAIHLAKNQVYHARTKHIDVRYHFVREILEEGKAATLTIAKSAFENVADNEDEWLLMSMRPTELLQVVVLHTQYEEQTYRVNKNKQILDFGFLDMPCKNKRVLFVKGIVDFMRRASSIYVNVFTGEAIVHFPCARQMAIGGILADAMGLRKTVMTIALILSRLGKGNPDNEKTVSRKADDSRTSYKKDAYGNVPRRAKGNTLIICPMALLSQWKDELETHSRPETLSIFVHDGGERTNNPRVISEHDVVLTTYGVLTASYKSDAGNIIHHRVDWYRVVLDEARTIKSSKTIGARACFGLSAHCRWCLTGTPLRTILKISIAYCASCMWKAKIQGPYENGNPTGLKLIKAILRLLTPILVLPPTDIQTIECEQSEAERDFYDPLFKRSKVGKVLHNYASILELLLRLRQCCNHAFLFMSRADSQQYSDLNKLARRFLEIHSDSITPTQNAPTKAYIEEVVDGIRRVENTECPICMESADDPVLTPCAHRMCRECLLSSWRTPTVGLCPICRTVLKKTVRAGGVGLNLTAVSNVFLMDPWWNPAVEGQAILQLRNKQSCESIESDKRKQSLLEETVEERMQQVQARKQKTIAGALTDEEVRSARIEKLKMLFR